MDSGFIARCTAFIVENFGLSPGPARLLVLGALAGGGWMVLRQATALLPRRRRRRRPRVGAASPSDQARHLEVSGDSRAARRLREKAAAQAEASNDWLGAADHLHALGRHGEAGRLLLKAGRHEDAAREFRRAGSESDAARALELGQRLDEAAQLYVSAGRLNDALRCLQRATSSRAPAALRAKRCELAGHAALIAEKLGRARLAAEMHELSGEVEAAAAAYLAAGEPGRAGPLFEDAGAWRRAAAAYEAAGHREAHRRCAAEAALRDGHPERAAPLLEELGRWDAAAAAHAAAGSTQDAARCHEQAGNPSAAALLYEEAGDVTKAAECHARGGEPWRAGVLFEQVGSIGRALACLAEVPSGSSRFLQARGLAGLLRARRGERAAAKVLLEQVVAALDEAHRSDPELATYLQALADCRDAEGDLDGALECLRRAAMLDPGDGAVSAKLEALDSRLKRRSRDRPNDRAPERYRVLRELASGGMGRVYLAEDVALERHVALKVLSEEWQQHPELRERFVREARVAAKLSHPNVVAVFDVGEVDDRPYIALEYVEGRDLRSLVRERGRLDVEEARPILTAVAEALSAAHAEGIVHRDVKPANVFLGEDGRVKLGDFGIARLDGVDATRSGIAVGTPRYMAPEQVRADPVDARADIYALGVTAFHLLTGRTPFDEGDLAYQHVHVQPPDPRDFAPELPPLLAHLVLSCLAKKPEHRPPTAERFVQLLDAACTPKPVG